MEKNKKRKYLSLAQILEQNPVSCGNCSHFKIKKKIHIGWQSAKRCRYFDGEATKE